MPPPLPRPALDRLSKLTGMLGSSHDGERANAASLATKLLKSHDWTWADVIQAVEGAASISRSPAGHEEAPFDDDDPDIDAVNKTAMECLRHPDLLNEREAAFCRSMEDWDTAVSAKQLQWLAKLRRRVAAAKAARAAA